MWVFKKGLVLSLGTSNTTRSKNWLLKKSTWLSLEKFIFLHYLLYMGTCSGHPEQMEECGQLPWPHCKCPKARLALGASLSQNGACLVCRASAHQLAHQCVFLLCQFISLMFANSKRTEPCFTVWCRHVILSVLLSIFVTQFPTWEMVITMLMCLIIVLPI